MAVKQNESSDSEKISLRFQDPELQCPSYTAIYNQFQDLVRTQTSMAAKLRYMVCVLCYLFPTLPFFLEPPAY